MDDSSAMIDKTLRASAKLVPYRPALEAVLAAGARLRAAFDAPGGPQGSCRHALCDQQAEWIIRSRLRAAWPRHGYLSEKGGSEPAARRCHYTWVIDPNDGSSAFMRGFRGSAVSVALLRAGEPIFAVVYAHNYPAPPGDLITWAKGGPLVRNGFRVAGRDDGLNEAEQIIFVSQKADCNAPAHLACTAPRRYAGLPSVAYRLALVAAGEGVAAVSLARPVSWNVAAGHGLLRSAGMDLFDAHGRPIRYTADGRLKNATAKPLIGGEAGVCRHLLCQDWASGLEPSSDGAVAARIAWPRPGAAVADAGRLARAQGCLLGQLCGDALGSQVEFVPLETIAWEYPQGLGRMQSSPIWNTLAGQPTDDSEMALSLARCLVARQDYERMAVLRAYKAWAGSRPFGMGAAIRAALIDGRPRERTQANGALMRISPLGIFAHATVHGQTAVWASEDAALTHPHAICQQINILFVRAIATAVAEGPGAHELYARIARWAEAMNTDAAIQDCILQARDQPPANYSEHAGWVLTAFHNALWQLCHAGNLAEGVIDTVRRGGDTDTNAAIAGALLGAVHGIFAIPAQWRRMVLSCRPLVGFAHTCGLCSYKLSQAGPILACRWIDPGRAVIAGRMGQYRGG